MEKQFDDYLHKTRSEFVLAVNELQWNTGFRTKCENLLIAFDQMRNELKKHSFDSSLLEEIRQSFADYHASEGCSCCQDIEPHKEASLKLGQLLGAKTFEDGSGVDWYAYRSKK